MPSSSLRLAAISPNHVKEIVKKLDHECVVPLLLTCSWLKDVVESVHLEWITARLATKRKMWDLYKMQRHCMEKKRLDSRPLSSATIIIPCLMIEMEEEKNRIETAYRSCLGELVDLSKEFSPSERATTLKTVAGMPRSLWSQ